MLSSGRLFISLPSFLFPFPKAEINTGKIAYAIWERVSSWKRESFKTHKTLLLFQILERRLISAIVPNCSFSESLFKYSSELMYYLSCTVLLVKISMKMYQRWRTKTPGNNCCRSFWSRASFPPNTDLFFVPASHIALLMISLSYILFTWRLLLWNAGLIPPLSFCWLRITRN